MPGYVAKSKFADENLAFITLDGGICNKCVYVLDTGEACKAFPGGIPDVILTGEFDHRKPYKGDNGIQFKKREGMAS